MFKRPRLPLILLIAVAMMAFGANFAAMANEGEPILFQFKVPENQSFVYESVTRLSMSLGDGTDFPLNQTIEQFQMMTIEYGTTQADGTTPFTLRIHDVVIDDMDVGEMVRQLFGLDNEGALIEYSGLVDAEGQIVQVEVLTENPFIGELIDVHEVMENISVPFPNEPLVVGDTWQIEETVPLEEIPGLLDTDVSVEAVYTLLAVDRAANTATIEALVKGSMEVEAIITPDDDPTLPGNMHMFLTLDVEGEGTTVVDMETGQLVFSQAVMLQWIEMNLSMPEDLPGAEETVLMPMTVEMEIRLIEKQ